MDEAPRVACAGADRWSKSCTYIVN